MNNDKPNVLIVDDEASILRSLHRVLRKEFNVYQAEGGEQAVELMGEHQFAVIVCDQRMPGMSGAEVLGRSVELTPDSFRITLTGYTDMEAAQRSINEGKVNQFLTKPWNDEHIQQVVRQGVASYDLVRENRRLTELTIKQNAELEMWNKQLEQKVKHRTDLLRQQNTMLRAVSDRLKNSLRDTVGVLAGMLEAVSPALSIHAKRVARLSVMLGKQMDLGEQELHDVEFAAHLHDIGKIMGIGRSTGPARKRKASNDAEAGFAILCRVGGFENIAKAVRHQAEQFDGNGRPNGLTGPTIPLAARIIAVAEAYDDALYSRAMPNEQTHREAQKVLRRGRGNRFDPMVVDLLIEIAQSQHIATTIATEVELSPRQIKVGMTLSRDFRNAEGMLLLKEDTQLTDELIGRIRELSGDGLLVNGVCVKYEPRADEEAVTEAAA